MKGIRRRHERERPRRQPALSGRVRLSASRTAASRRSRSASGRSTSSTTLRPSPRRSTRSSRAVPHDRADPAERLAGAAHLSISDPSGDSAIFEYLGGKLVIHHGKQYQVMTNSPPFDDQLALNAYWKSIGGLTFLPGTNRAADRFARASFLINAIPTEADPDHHGGARTELRQPGRGQRHGRDARASSVPLGITTPGEPNIASTLWRTVADQKNKVYFFDSATSPNTFWVPLADLDFKEGAPVKKLTMAGRQGLLRQRGRASSSRPSPSPSCPRAASSRSTSPLVQLVMPPRVGWRGVFTAPRVLPGQPTPPPRRRLGRRGTSPRGEVKKTRD